MYFATTDQYATGSKTRMMIDYNGNVGIGTDSPIGNLNINGGTGDAAAQDAIETFTRTSSTGNVLAAKLRLVDGSATTHGDLKFQVKTTASSAENDAYYTDAITIKGNNANVGIGTDTPSALLEIQTVGTSGNQDFQIFSRGESPNYEVFKISRAAGSTELLANQNLTLSADYDANHTSVDSNIIFKTDNTERMRITNGGDIQFTGNSHTPYIQLVNSGRTAGNPGFTFNNDTNTGMFQPSGVADTIAFSTAGTERMRIDSSGDVTIQTSGADDIKNFTINSSNGSSQVAGFVIQNDGANGYIHFKAGAANATPTTKLTIGNAANSGNVGIGTTSPSGKVDILGLDLNIGADNGAPTTRTNSTVKVGVITSPHYTTAEENFTGMLLIGNTTANEVILGGGTSTYNSATQIKFYTGANSTTVTGTERMRIDSSGKVGIGTTSPSDKLTLDSGQMRLSDNYGIRWGSASTAIYGSSGAGTLQIFTNSAERMRITSGGDVDIAPVSGSSVIDYGMTVAPQSGYAQIYLRANTTSTTYLQRFYNESSGVLQNVGNIVISGSSTNYVTTSDYRLKEDLQDFAGLDMVSKISVYDFKWKRDESRSYGVMAHELQEVLPQAVVGEKDAEEMQSVDYSKIVPLLVKSIQELTAKVDKLEQECKCKN